MTPSSGCEHTEHAPAIDAALAELFGLDDAESFRLYRQFHHVHHALCALVKQRSPADQLSHARMRLLLRLAVHDRQGAPRGLLPSELSRWLCVSRNTVSALLNGLEEQGFIARHADPTDRRRVQIHLTEAGKAHVQRYAPPVGALLESVFGALTPAERHTLLTLLEKLQGRVRALQEEQNPQAGADGPLDAPTPHPREEQGP